MKKSTKKPRGHQAAAIAAAVAGHRRRQRPGQLVASAAAPNRPNVAVVFLCLFVFSSFFAFPMHVSTEASLRSACPPRKPHLDHFETKEAVPFSFRVQDGAGRNRRAPPPPQPPGSSLAGATLGCYRLFLLFSHFFLPLVLLVVVVVVVVEGGHLTQKFEIRPVISALSSPATHTHTHTHA